ncbi:cytochrome P450 78A9 [Amborella trichopoda]|uniref:Uncharacterized protein n=1 Tax=Amborella trichopoda TaxID=13333 RepID=W1PL64_AMBTC|nr:cytochrome P450 78A9 [Amborella trichopoda]ERN10732.1 hypothetical protein AMTR_s00027p00127290 [Amborella trichopoda]|eukprot:XP_006849151.1 cytochrome P450 78A9 [Amborella trichopoda]
MDSTVMDNWWLLAVPANCFLFSALNAFLLVFFSFMATMCVYWAWPGGPAWGKYWSAKGLFRRAGPTIPGPRGWPLIGSLNLMTGLPHRRLQATASRLGAVRLMAFSLGETRAIITSHPDVAKEILNSSAFADRPIKESAYGLMFHRAIGFAPYGPYWRGLRRIAATHVFSRKQINGSEPRRLEIAALMTDALAEAAKDGRDFRIRRLLKRASLNNVMATVFGRRYEFDQAEPEAVELSQLVEEGYEILGTLNWSDHLSLLDGLDLQGVRRRCSKLVPHVNRFVKGLLEENRVGLAGETANFARVLMSMEGSEKLSEDDMVAVLWEMIFRGTDTVAILIEWALARLALHPDVQARVHEELDIVVGPTRHISEADLPNLPYLNALLKETVRLHPPGPLLSWARLSTVDTTVDGRHVPQGTTAMVNMWAIARDPSLWPDPLAFRPERFLDGEDFSIMGSDLRLAPFGSGRRSCPGKALGLKSVTIWVAYLLHEFEWRPSDKEPVDLTEVMRLSCEMKRPLAVKPWPRRR